MQSNSFPTASKCLVLGVLALVTTGCGNAIEGRWESKEDSAEDLEVASANDGFEGSGHLYLTDGVDTLLCPFDFTMTDSGDDRFEMNGHFTNECSSAGPFDGVECELKSDELLKCDIGGGVNIEYDKNKD